LDVLVICVLCEMMQHVGILAVSEINEAIDRQVVSQTLLALQSSAASLAHVECSNAAHYQQLLARIKSEKAQVEISLCVSAVSNETLCDFWIFSAYYCLFLVLFYRFLLWFCVVG